LECGRFSAAVVRSAEFIPCVPLDFRNSRNEFRAPMAIRREKNLFFAARLS